MDLDYVAWDVWPPVFLEATVVCMGELSSGGEEACSRIPVVGETEWMLKQSRPNLQVMCWKYQHTRRRGWAGPTKVTYK